MPPGQPRSASGATQPAVRLSCRGLRHAPAFAECRSAVRQMPSGFGICGPPFRNAASVVRLRHLAKTLRICRRWSGAWTFVRGDFRLGQMSGPSARADKCPGRFRGSAFGRRRPGLGHLCAAIFGPDICPGAQTFVRAPGACGQMSGPPTFVQAAAAWGNLSGRRRGGDGSGQDASDYWTQDAVRKALTPVQPPGICRGLRHLPTAVQGLDICPGPWRVRTFVRVAGACGQTSLWGDICSGHLSACTRLIGHKKFQDRQLRP
jgi:hypothetical protein